MLFFLSCLLLSKISSTIKAWRTALAVERDSCTCRLDCFHGAKNSGQTPWGCNRAVPCLSRLHSIAGRMHTSEPRHRKTLPLGVSCGFPDLLPGLQLCELGQQPAWYSNSRQIMPALIMPFKSALLASVATFMCHLQEAVDHFGADHPFTQVRPFNVSPLSPRSRITHLSQQVQETSAVAGACLDGCFRTQGALPVV